MVGRDDGRLELDELGSVIDHASPLGRGDDLLEGNDSITWGERLENAGVTPWLRRHRVALAAGAAAVLLLGAAGTAWVRTRPPDLIGSVAVHVSDWASDANGFVGIANTGPATFEASYKVTPQRSGDSVRILGLVGPGIRASSARPVVGSGSALDGTAVTPGSDVSTVVAVIGCDDPGLTTSTADDYRLRVEETDAYGRTVVGTIALPLSSTSQWVDNSVAPCLQERFFETIVPTKVEVSGDLATRTVLVDVTVHNGYGHDLTAAPMQYQQQSVYVTGELQAIATGTDAVVRVRARVTDCSNPVLDDAYVPDTVLGGGSRPVPGIGLSVTPGDVPPIMGGTIAAVFTAEQQARVASLLTRMCSGVPRATMRVVSAGLSPVAAADEFVSTGDPSTVALRMTVDVATSAQRVLLGDGQAAEDIRNGALVTITTARAAVVRGHARLTVDWAVTCNGGVNPPTVQLEESTGGRSWPLRATLSDRALLAAYRAACPMVTTRDLEGMGWPTG